MKKLLIYILFLLPVFAFGQNIPRPNIPAPHGLAVNSYTGNLFYQRNEMSLRGTGYRVYQSFYYNAATDTLDYGYGHGWSFYYNIFYIETANSIIIQHSDAKKDTFLLSGGVYVSPTGVFETLTKAGGVVTLKSKDGRQQIFGDATHKKITSMTDANGNYVVIQYNGAYPAKIRNSTGRCLLLNWQNGHLNDASDSANPSKKYIYTYDSKNDLIKTTNPLGGEMRFEYQYYNIVRLADEDGNPVVVSYLAGRVKRIVSCNTEQEFIYVDGQNKTYVSQKAQSGTITNGYIFDAQNRLSALSDADKKQTTFAYDSKNNLVEWKDFKGLSTKYEYDSKGNVLKETDPKGNATIYTYEPTYNRMASVKDKRGNTTTLTYDANGNLKTVAKPGSSQSFTYDASGRILTAKNANGKTTTYQYNTDGDLVQILYPVGSVQYQYNGNCCGVSKIIDANGNTQEMTYDLMGRPTSVKDKTGNTITYVYDAAGNVIKEIDPKGIPKEYGYDALNRLNSVKLKVGTWHYDYDGQSNLVTITDANGHKTNYEYNNKSQLTKETDAIGNSTGYSYDLNGNLVIRSDPNGNVVNYKYDELNRLTEKSYTGNTDKYSYDAEGNMVSAYNNNIAYTFNYDNLIRLLKKNIITWGKSLTYAYDSAGNRKLMIDYEGDSTTYNYDNNNRLTSLKNPSNLTTSFQYDLGGRTTKQINGNGTYTTYHYDQAGRMDSLVNWKNSTTKISFFYYNFDQYGNRTSMTDKHGLSTYTYDSAYRLTKVVYADGSIETFEIDGTGNRTKRVKNSVVTPYTYNNADQVQTGGVSTYAFDANGNTIQQNDSLQRVYRYDGENRLLEVRLNPQKKVLYQYDPLGDKIFMQDTSMQISKFIYDGVNLLSELDVSNTNKKKYCSSFEVDSWLSVNKAGNNFFFAKDGLNSISEITNSIANSENQYRYDIYGNVLEKSENIQNSLLYTGRFYESSIELYDYRKRFFNPVIGKFISKDNFIPPIEEPLTLNKFAYVGNNPQNFVDPSGEFFVPLLWFIGGLATGTFLGEKYVAAPSDKHTKRNCGMVQPGQNPNGLNSFNDPNGNTYWNPVEPGKAKWHNFKDDENNYGWDWLMKGFDGSSDYKGYKNTKFLQYDNAGNPTGAEAIWNGKRWLKPGERNGPSRNYGKDPVSGAHIFEDILPDAFNPNYSNDCDPKNDDNHKGGGPNDPCHDPNAPHDPHKIPVECVTPNDPNEIIGPAGYGDTLKQWVSVNATLPYKVTFENSADHATAPAQNVTIYLPISDKFNINSLRISDFGFGDYNFGVPPNTATYTNRLDVKDSLGVYVDVTAGLDVANHRAFWILQSIDPATGLAATLAPDKGFLLVNDSITHRGEGYVNFTLQPNAADHTGDSAKATASIIFDTEDPIATNTWVNMVDAVAPISHLTASNSTNDSITLKFSGNDDSNGSGLKEYAVYSSDNNSPYTLYQSSLKDSVFNFPKTPGDVYQFFSVSKDNVDNLEPVQDAKTRSITVGAAPDFAHSLHEAITLNPVSFMLGDTIQICNYIRNYGQDTGTAYLKFFSLTSGNKQLIDSMRFTLNNNDSIKICKPWKVAADSGKILTQIVGSNPPENNLLNNIDTLPFRVFNLQIIPVITPSGTINLCYGDSVKLSVLGRYSSIHWNTGDTTPSITVKDSGNYTVTVTDSAGSVGTSLPVTIHIRPPLNPAINASGPLNFCAGQSVTLSGPVSFSHIKWSNGDTTVSIAVNTSGIYYVSVIDSLGCRDTSNPVTVNVYPVPAITVSPATILCPGSSVTLSSSSASAYLWNTGDTTQNITVTTPGTYSVKATYPTGCMLTSNSQTITTRVCGTPQSRIAKNITNYSSTLLWRKVECATAYEVAYRHVGDSGYIVVTATDTSIYLNNLLALSSYEWKVRTVCGLTKSQYTLLKTFTTLSGSNTKPNLGNDTTITKCAGSTTNLLNVYAISYPTVIWNTTNPQAADTGVYSLIVGNQFGSDTARITVLNNPKPSLGNDTTVYICAGDARSIRNVYDTSSFATVKYSTNRPDLAHPGTYSIYVTNQYGCTDTAIITVLVETNFVTVVTASGPLTFCKGDSIKLTVSGSFVQYNWNNGYSGNPLVVTNSGSYKVTVTNNHGCSRNSAVITVVTQEPLNPVITANVGSIRGICPGIIATLTSSALNNTWSTGETTQSINVNSTGNYSATTSDGLGCSATTVKAVSYRLCTTPSLYFTSSVTKTTASIYWLSLPCALSYDVSYRAIGSVNFITVNVTDTFTTLTGLSPFTKYVWKIRCVCPSGPGSYSNLKPFTTASGSKIELTRTKIIVNAEKENFGASISPNPTNNNSTLKVSGSNTPLNVNITSADGKSLWKNKNFIGNVMLLPVADYKAGVYLVTVNNGKEQKILKLLIEKK